MQAQNQDINTFKQQARNYLDTIQKMHLCQMNAFANPPSGVLLLLRVILVIVSEDQNSIQIDKKNNLQNLWARSKMMMQNKSEFMQKLKDFVEKVGQDQKLDKRLNYVQKTYLSSGSFTIDYFNKYTAAGKGLSGWVLNMVQYKKALYKKIQADLQNN